MAVKVPISVENIAFERLNLSRHYLTVDCDFTCYIVLNPSGNIPSEGTDICALHTGAWQIDAWTFLTKKEFPNQAGFSACLVWDKTLVSGTAHAPQCVESDIDTANSVSSLKGQPVNIVGFSMASGEALPVNISGVLPSSDGSLPVQVPLPVLAFPKRYKVLFAVGVRYPRSFLERFATEGLKVSDSEQRLYTCFFHPRRWNRSLNHDETLIFSLLYGVENYFYLYQQRSSDSSKQGFMLAYIDMYLALTVRETDTQVDGDTMYQITNMYHQIEGANFHANGWVATDDFSGYVESMSVEF